MADMIANRYRVTYPGPCYLPVWPDAKITEFGCDLSEDGFLDFFLREEHRGDTIRPAVVPQRTFRLRVRRPDSEHAVVSDEKTLVHGTVQRGDMIWYLVEEKK